MQYYDDSVMDSEEELDMDLDHSFRGFSVSDSSSHTLDSGVSSGTRTSSAVSWSPVESDQNDDWQSYSPTSFGICLDAHSILINQAICCFTRSDIGSIVSASAYLFHLCKSGHGSVIMQICPDFLRHILMVIRTIPVDSIEVFHFLSGILHYLSYTEEGVDFILCPHGVEILAKFLMCPVDSVLYYTVTSLHSLLLVRECARDIMRSSITGSLVTLLNGSVQHSEKEWITNEGTVFDANPKFLAVLCDCLHIIAYGHERTKQVFIERNAISSLVRLIKYSSYEKLLWTATRLLRVLSAWIPIKLEILTCDTSLRFLSRCLSTGSLRVVASTLWTLRNLSDLITNKMDVEDVNFIVGVLASRMQDSLDIMSRSTSFQMTVDLKDQLTICRCILDIIGNVTCGNSSVKSHLVKLNCIESVARVLHFVVNLSKSRVSHNPPVPEQQVSTLCQSVSSLSLRVGSNDRTDSTSHSPNEFASGHPLKHIHFPSLSSLNKLSFKCRSCEHLPSSKSRANQSNVNSSSTTSPFIFRGDTGSTYCSSSSGSASAFISYLNMDVVEGGFRCLSHLTAGHHEAINAIFHLTHRQSHAKMICETATYVLLPALSVLFHCEPCVSATIRRQTMEYERHLSQTVHLIRVWGTFVNNITVVCCPDDIKHSKSSIHNRCTSKHFPRRLFFHLKHILRCLMDRCAELADLTSEPSQKIVGVQQVMVHLLDKVTSGISNSRVKKTSNF